MSRYFVVSTGREETVKEPIVREEGFPWKKFTVILGAAAIAAALIAIIFLCIRGGRE